MHAPVLVLNASYEPINVCAARRAIVLVLKGVAMTEEENGHFLHAARLCIRVPSVIRLLEYRRIPHQTRALSRKNILIRDRFTCQYCSRTLPSGELTLDHVIPRSRAGETAWENLVACCHGCNRRKGNQLPMEANMKLIREPRAFNLHTSRHIMRLLNEYRNEGSRMQWVAQTASELADMENIQVRTVLVKDDVASAPPEEAQRRRGVAGMVFAARSSVRPPHAPTENLSDSYELAVTLAPSVVAPLFELLKSWVERKPSTPVKVRVKVGRRTAEIEYDPTRTSAKDLEALIRTLNKSVK